jgi:hypothetical protein
MAARSQSGSKLVVLAVAATVGMVGVGTIWAPFYADRDKLRGLHEEADPYLTESEKRQYEALMRQQQQLHQNGAASDGVATTTGTRPSNSIWGRLNQAATANAATRQQVDNNKDDQQHPRK